MNKLVRKMDAWMLKGQMKVKQFLSEERGDTNFISIAIILGVILTIAVVFIKLKGNIMSVTNKAVSDFTKEFK